MHPKFSVGQKVFYSDLSSSIGKLGNFRIKIDIYSKEIRCIEIGKEYIEYKLNGDCKMENELFSTEEEARSTINKNIVKSFIKFIEEN